MAKQSTTRKWPVWLFVIATGALSVWLASLWLRPQELLLARLEAELPHSSPEEAKSKLEQMAAFGEVGVPYLARAVKHPEPVIANAARSIVSEELDRWQLLTQREASRRLAKLARGLAENIDDSDDNTRRVCSDFATRLLLWPVDTRVVDQAQLISHCEDILLSVRREPVAAEDSEQLAGAAFVPGVSDLRRDPPLPNDLSPLDEALAIPGGDLPINSLPVPALPAEHTNVPRALPVSEEPRLIPTGEPPQEPRRFFPDAARSEAVELDTAALRRAETMMLVQQLASPVSHERDAAEEVLRERGFSEAHLNVARKFSDPRPDVRRRLVDQLAAQAVIDGKPWLLRLLDDSDARVRLATARILATSDDAQVVKRLQERAALENDPDVRALLRR